MTCCEEWLLFENFYEWLHEQDNFDKWFNNKMWALDKDILVKKNKIYSPDRCCLVPQRLNSLFVKGDAVRGSLPIGVEKVHDKFRSSQVHNIITGKTKRSCSFDTIEEAFEAYKTYKEDVIRQVAEAEYSKDNITKACYEAMMNYKIEIDD